ncbi:hypothetical protein CRG98_021858, partial [Punica granatum]
DNLVGIPSKEKGGYRACMFVFGLASLENIGFVANMASMVLYFYGVLCFDLSTSADTLTNFMGTACLLSLLGAFISDTYVNRLYTCLIFGTLEVVALGMVTLQAYSKDLRPEGPCEPGKSSCIEGGKAVFLYSSMILLAIGAGSVKGALPALGADQFDRNDGKAHASYFNWYMLSTTLGAIIGVTGVIVAALRNKDLSVPENPNQLHEIDEKERDPSEVKLSHTDQFRFLDKAAVLRDGAKAEPWTVCTVTQVEEVKVLIRMLPIIASTIIMNTCMAQLQTFSVTQGHFMDPHIGSYKFPTASIPVIPLLFMLVLIPLYEFVFVPFARKITGRPSGITQLQRVGVGLVLSIILMSIAGIVEVKRRHRAIENPLKPMISVFWLSFQYSIFGIADMFTVVGLLDFFYKEAPSGMRSLSTSFTWLSLSFGYFLSTIFVNMINSITRRVTPSKKGWLHGQDLNSNNLDLFYWFLAIVSCINLANYLFWASWYKYKQDADEHEPEAKPRKVERAQE